MKTTIDKLFQGYTLKEIEEILLKSTIENIKMKKRLPLFNIANKENSIKPQLKV